MLLIRWFLSGTVRQATDLRKQVLKLLAAQRDILKPEETAAIETSAAKLQAALVSGADKKSLQDQMAEVERIATERLRPYPNANARENVEVILVAIAVAMSIRTFFLQPFKIPTGSMQPTLYGITHEKLGPDFKIPGGWERVKAIAKGISYIHEVADSDGDLTDIKPPVRFGFFNLSQRYTFNGRNHTIWFPPEYGSSNLGGRSGTYPGQSFKKGDDIFKLQVKSGDHLFVDRVTYNFRHPTRGEIVVFETKGIKHPNVPEDQFYIKRLVGLPKDRLSIATNQHLVVNGRQLDAGTARFENVYTFDPVYKENHYFGHTPKGFLSDPRQEFNVGTDRMFVLGDNTENSLDSRYWGDVSERNVIGKSAFVYWPLSSRFGWSHR